MKHLILVLVISILTVTEVFKYVNKNGVCAVHGRHALLIYK